MQTLVTPLMMKYFHYGDYENSLLYLLGGVELIFVSIAMTFVSKRVSDRFFILLAMVLNLFSIGWFLIFVPGYKIGTCTGSLPSVIDL